MDLVTHEYDSGLVIAFPEQLQLEGDQSHEFKERIRKVIDGRVCRVVVDLTVGRFATSGRGGVGRAGFGLAATCVVRLDTAAFSIVGVALTEISGHGSFWKLGTPFSSRQV